MTEQSRTIVLNDDQWAVLGPLIDECRPRGKTEPVALRETIEAVRTIKAAGLSGVRA